MYPLIADPAEPEVDTKDKSGNMKYGLLFSTVIPLILFIFLSSYIVAESVVYVRSASLLNRNVKFGIQVMERVMWRGRWRGRRKGRCIWMGIGRKRGMSLTASTNIGDEFDP